MLHFDIKVNNEVIATCEIVRRTNTEVTGLNDNDVSIYAVSIYQYPGLTVFKEVTHRYGDGALELARKALS